MRQHTIPPQALLCGGWRACLHVARRAARGRRLGRAGAEFFADAPPSTALGEADFWHWNSAAGDASRLPAVTRPFLLTLLPALCAPATASARPHLRRPRPRRAPARPAVKKATSIDVLLPSQFTSDLPKLYSEGRGAARSYRFDIGAVRDCGGARRLLHRELPAERGGKPSNPRRSPHRGRPATSSRCAAAPPARRPSIEWVAERRALHDRGQVRHEEDRAPGVTRLANSAIARPALAATLRRPACRRAPRGRRRGGRTRRSRGRRASGGRRRGRPRDRCGPRR